MAIHQLPYLLDQGWSGRCGRKSLVDLLEAAGFQGLGCPDVVMVRQRDNEQECRHPKTDGRGQNALEEYATFHEDWIAYRAANRCQPIFLHWPGQPQPAWRV